MLSPLRYPGGKTSLHKLIANIIHINGMAGCEYVEPYAGGCGLALALLGRGIVKAIHINDVDPAIWSFWHCVLERANELISLIEDTPVTMEEYLKAKRLYHSAINTLDRGFATFFLNRVHRSGVFEGASVIGGLMQTGKYKMDCRYNKSVLIERIRKIAEFHDQIYLSNLDAIDFMKLINRKITQTFVYLDPPYWGPGNTLYPYHYQAEDHKALADWIPALEHPWILSYDDRAEIEALYWMYPRCRHDAKYSAGTKRIESEMMIFSPHLQLPKPYVTLS